MPRLSIDKCCSLLLRFLYTDSTQRQSGSGRPPALTSDEAREVVAVAESNPFLSSVQICHELQLHVSANKTSYRWFIEQKC